MTCGFAGKFAQKKLLEGWSWDDLLAKVSEARDGEPDDPPEEKIYERKCGQNEQRRPQQTAIERFIPIRRRYQLKRGNLGKRRPFGLAGEIAEVPRRTRWGKPCAGPHDVEISSRLHIEAPAIHGTKNLHGYLLNPLARPCAALIIGGIIVQLIRG